MEFHKIRCFRHCSTLKNVYCLVIPESCSICGAHLKSCAYLLPPFCVPSPFSFHLSTLLNSPHVSSFQAIKPYSLVVKPTKGDFLRYVYLLSFDLTHFSPIFDFYTPCKRQKNLVF